jgi:hypothetical protein
MVADVGLVSGTHGRPRCLWTCLVPGAYACCVSMSEVELRFFERLLPGDGAGAERVSPLCAASGRFQVMTAGR